MAEYEALKSKMQKRIGNTPLYSYKMSSRLCNLQQNLSSKHSKDSKINISKRSLGKPTGIKLYSQLKKKARKKSILITMQAIKQMDIKTFKKKIIPFLLIALQTFA